jgi:hypothetical protein
MAAQGKEEDRSFHAYSAIMLCFYGLLVGGFALRLHREEVMMRTLPATDATVLSLRPTKNSFAAEISLTRIAEGRPIACHDQIGLDRSGRRTHIGAVVRVVPRTDSCSEAVGVGERNTVAIAMASGVLLIATLISGIITAWSALRTRPCA